MHRDADACYRAVQSRDARFDGWFFSAVTSTGIYCRPSCPAVTPKRANITFYPSAAAAQAAGFRACLRCRPDAAPGSPAWNGRADVAARAMRLILDGTVDRQGVGGLARRLGYSERQLHRLLLAEVGAGPLALARAQRAQTARVLIETTALPMAQVAFAAGFASVRQFNDTVRAVFARTPSELRARARHQAGGAPGPGGLTLRLSYRQPLAAPELLGFLGARAVPGLEHGDEGAFARSLRLPRGDGRVHLVADEGFIRATFHLADLRDLTTAVTRVRRLLDLDADPAAVDAQLGTDPLLGPLVARTPGRRVAGTADGFELAVRAVVGQQISVAGARTVLRRLVDAAGVPLADPGAGVTHAFPGPEQVAGAADTAFAMPAGRRRALRRLAEAVGEGRLDLDPGADPAEVALGLQALPGIGPWTASYVALRALGDPDVLLPTDLGLRRAVAALGLPDAPASVTARAEAWRPWRSYAMAHLWSLPPGPSETAPAAPIADKKASAA